MDGGRFANFTRASLVFIPSYDAAILENPTKPFIIRAHTCKCLNYVPYFIYQESVVRHSTGECISPGLTGRERCEVLTLDLSLYS